MNIGRVDCKEIHHMFLYLTIHYTYSNPNHYILMNENRYSYRYYFLLHYFQISYSKSFTINLKDL